MNLDLSSGGFAVLGAILGIWGLVAFVFFLWYLWALSKLFPYLGLPSSHGWIPLWNQWQLINRAGLPGWVVLLVVVPGLVVVGIVFSIMAVHRLNKEFGKDASYTVLGAFLPPIWAMLLASHISDGMYAGASVYTGQSAFPPLAPHRSASAWPEPVAPGEARPVAPGTQPATEHPQDPQVAENPAWQGLPPVPQLPPPGVAPPATPGPQPAVNPQGAVTPQDPHAMNDWGFSRTTEGNFERLAAEEVAARPAPPLGASRAAEPFAWPGDTADPPRDAAAEYAALPSAGPSAEPVRAADPEPGSEAPAHVATAAEPDAADVTPAAALPVAPEPAGRLAPAVPEDAGPSIFDLDPVAAPIVSAEPVPALQAPELPDLAPATPVPPVGTAPTVGEWDDNVDDRTVVVSAPIRWGLELPGGEVLELLGDDLIVGRKPERMDGAELLSLADPTRTVSKSHARLRFDGEGWSVEDLNSTNGLSAADDSGTLTPLAPGQAHAVPERMVLGTLEVRVRPLERGELL